METELLNDKKEMQKQLIAEYLEHLCPMQKKAYEIAKAHLGSSFNLVKSNGYIEWAKNRRSDYQQI